MEDKKIFDKAAVMDRLGNDTELLQELLQMLFSDIDQKIVSIKASISKDDFDGIEKKAHSLKSALGNLGADISHNYAFQIELAGRNATNENLENLIEAFSESIENFKEAVKEYM